MEQGFDRELAHLPQALRWREWGARVEAVLFASAMPVGRDILARVIGKDCALDLLIEDISASLADRPYDIYRSAGGWQMRSSTRYSDAIKAARDLGEMTRQLSQKETQVLAIIAYMQPVTRSAISRMIGRDVSRDMIARLHQQGLIARGPRSPEPGAPYSYVTAAGFLAQFGLESLRDLPDLEALADAGLLAVIDDAKFDMPLGQEL